MEARLVEILPRYQQVVDLTTVDASRTLSDGIGAYGSSYTGFNPPIPFIRQKINK